MLNYPLIPICNYQAVERLSKIYQAVKKKAPLLGTGVLIAFSTAICARPDPESIQYTQAIKEELQPGNMIEILSGNFQISSDVNRRSWEEVLYFFMNGKSNLSYYERKEEVTNPIFHEFNQKPSEKYIDGKGWIVYFPQKSPQAAAVVLDRNTASEIIVNYNPTVDILDLVPILRRRVEIKRVFIDPLSHGPAAYYQENDGSLHRIATATTIR